MDSFEWQVGVPRVMTDYVSFGLDHLGQHDTVSWLGIAVLIVVVFIMHSRLLFGIEMRLFFHSNSRVYVCQRSITDYLRWQGAVECARGVGLRC